MTEEERGQIREQRGGVGGGKGRAQVTEEEGKVRAAEGVAEGIGPRSPQMGK